MTTHAAAVQAVLICALMGNTSTALAAAKSADKLHPDFSGVWQASLPYNWIDPTKDAIPLTPAYAKMLDQWRKASDSGHPVADSVARCEAFGMPRIMSFGFMEILETPGRVTIISEILHEVRRIYTNDRAPPPDLELSYEGFSSGHWEGKALSVTTVGLQAGTLDQYGIPHSDQLKVLERIELVDENKLRDRVTLIDPLAYTIPWTIDRFYERRPNVDIQEYICNTNGAAIPATSETSR